MKQKISKILQLILIIIGLPFYIVDFFRKNKVCEYVISKINKWEDGLNWWGNR
jgi:hypothetical protein